MSVSHRVFRIAFAAAVLLTASHALGRELRPGFTIGKEFALRSDVLNEERSYWVSLPASYDTSLHNRYPVLYVLDAEANFHISASVADFMSFGTYGNNTQIPELIVVAIANTNRIRDMTPTHSSKGLDGRPTSRYALSGGGDQFLDFLENELVPIIDSTYRTLPHRTLAGHSLAGLLAAHAFMTRPDTFQAHIVIDPSLWWDDEALVRRPAASRPRLPATNVIYLALANNPSVGMNNPQKELQRGRKFAKLLKSAVGQHSRVKHEYFKNEDHAAVPLLSIYHGLRFVFEEFPPPLAETINRPAALREHFERLHARLGVRLLPTEAFLDQTGSHLLYTLRELDKAAELFSYYESIYPFSYIPRVSLGDIYLEAGDHARAADSYEKALELSPQDQYVQGRIKALTERIQSEVP